MKGELLIGQVCGTKLTSAAFSDGLTQFQRLLDTFPSAAYICDPDGLITYYNQAALQLWGRAPRLNDPTDRFCGAYQLLSSKGELITHDQGLMATALRERKASGSQEIIIEQPGGRRAHVLAHISLIHDAAGEFAGAVNVMVDITKEKRSEEERWRLESQFLHSQKLETLGLMAGGVAHDFNNLLTVALGHANLALAELPPGSPVSPMIHEIERAAQQAADLARQMLNYSGRGRSVVEVARVDTMVQEMSRLLRVAVPKKITVNLELESALINADLTQIRQVLMNLIMNAADAMGSQSGLIKVRTGTRHMESEHLSSPQFSQELPAGNYAFIEVEDTGCGMTQEVVDRIFDPFFTTKPSGRGLGLAAVIGIVKNHRGVIKVTSAPGRGSTFQVILPCVQSSIATIRTANPSGTGPKGSGLVLVVDDESSVRHFTGRVLERAGFHVQTAGDGREGLEVFRQHAAEIKAVVLDMTMRGMDGRETIQRLRELHPNVPVLIMSGYGEAEVAERFAGMGATGFIQKPFHSREFLTLVCNAVNAADGNERASA